MDHYPQEPLLSVLGLLADEGKVSRALAWLPGWSPTWNWNPQTIFCPLRFP